jgi:TDG/mug DNA glycosylase family protein
MIDESHVTEHPAMIRRMDRTTIDVYEQGAARWRDSRPARFLERAERLGRSIPSGLPRVDLGCGAGLHLRALGDPVVALDAAFAMAAIARDTAPAALPVQADLEHLPFRRAALGASWARASYLHVAATRLPWSLMELHGALQVGAPAEFVYAFGQVAGSVKDDGDFPGRFFAEWEPAALADVHVGAGFDVHECEHDGGEWITVAARRARTLPDFVDAGMHLLVCGLNPSEYAADAGVGFARPGNRFWPAALEAGIVTRDRDPRHALVAHGVGMTDLVKRATPRADALTRDEYRAGADRVRRLVEWLRPGAVCFVGLAGYRAAIDRAAVAGPIAEGFGGVPAYLMPNPSGLNAHATVSSLAEHLRAALALTTQASR